MNSQMISVIVPTYNSARFIGNCLRALSKQSYSRSGYEVIVVDDGSDDNTQEIVSKYKVKYFRRPHSGPASARNFGVEKSRGSIILFTDADCVPDRNWVRSMVEPFNDKNVVGVSGTYRTFNKESVVARFAGYEIEERHKTLAKQDSIDFVGTFSAGYRKGVFLKFGGFDTKFGMASGEDAELSFKISKSGGRMVFQPKAFVSHMHPDTVFKYLRQKFWRGYWRVLLYRKHKDKLMRHSYTPKTVFLEEATVGPFAVSLVLLMEYALGIRWDLAIGNVLFGMIALLCLSSSAVYVACAMLLTASIIRKDLKAGLASPFIIFLRDFVILMGVIHGNLTIIFRGGKK